MGHALPYRRILACGQKYDMLHSNAHSLCLGSTLFVTKCGSATHHIRHYYYYGGPYQVVNRAYGIHKDIHRYI